MKCPYSKSIPNPTFAKLYPYFCDEYGKFDVLRLPLGVDAATYVHEYCRVQPTLTVPCGKCSICMSNKQQEWVLRLKHELQNSIGAQFYTLTYDDIHLPFVDPGGNFTSLETEVIQNYDVCVPTLRKDHLQKFLKRLRKDLDPIKVRFFAIGEYGGKLHRPHYHMILFGLPNQKDVMNIRDDYNPIMIVQKHWWYGNVSVGEANGSTINYITSYMLISKDSPHGDLSEPSFAVMSRRPGIGYYFLESKEREFFYKHNIKKLYTTLDGLKVPLPRYYKDKLLTDEQKIELQEWRWKNEDLFTPPDPKQQLLAITKDNILRARYEKKKKHIH